MWISDTAVRAIRFCALFGFFVLAALLAAIAAAPVIVFALHVFGGGA